MGSAGGHLEGSVMSIEFLGTSIDNHGGGLENQLPQHECEIAQSEAVHGAPFVRYWLHNNMVTVDGVKMGKSLNNFITLKEAFAGCHERLSQAYEPLAVRQLILNSHYRSPLDFSDAALHAALSGYNRITATVIAVRKKEGSAPEGPLDEQTNRELDQFRETFETAMNDDLNTSVALSVMFDLVSLANRLLAKDETTKRTLNAVDSMFRKLGGGVLGIVRETYTADRISAAEQNRLAKLVDALMQERKEAWAGRIDIDGGGIFCADRILNDGCGVWTQGVHGEATQQNQIQLRRVKIGGSEGAPRRHDCHVGEIAVANSTFFNAGPAGNPLVGGIHECGQVCIAEYRRW